MPKPIISWPGGKRRLLKHLYPHFPIHDCYVEAFAGLDLVPSRLDYTIGGGQGRAKKFGELIIKNWSDRQTTFL
nr:hypothetical protein [Stenotrophomonas maltophilia]